MKIKRTKTGTKTSDSKHEIVKSEQNGLILNEESSTMINCKKQVNPIGVPASPSSSANKRGNNSHRKEKAKDKLQTKDKPEIASLTHQESQCSCGSDKLASSSCSCLKHRDLNLPPRVPSNQSQISLRYASAISFVVKRSLMCCYFSLEKQSSAVANSSNASIPPKESSKVSCKILKSIH